MKEEAPKIMQQLFIKHLQVMSPITATDIAEMTWHQFSALCSSDLVELLRHPDYNGIMITVIASTPIQPAEIEE
jgi:hypothetical protein